MGTTSSHHHHLDSSPMMDHQAMYPDMNVIFKGIPKVMQATEDLHVLAVAVSDLRNLTFILSFIMVVGMILFLAMKCLQGRRGKLRRRRRLQNLTDSEHSSLSRPYRQYTQKPLDWNHHHHTKVDMEKLLEHSSSSHGSQQHTPPAVTPKRLPDYHTVERTPPPLVQTTNTIPATANGTAIKPLEPVKLMIDEVPYVDSSAMP